MHTVSALHYGKHIGPSAPGIMHGDFDWNGIFQYMHEPNSINAYIHAHVPTFSTIGRFSCNANYYSVGSATNNPSSFGPQGFPSLITASTRQYCTWRFYGTTGTRYQFKLMYFDIPENPNCSQNKLTIRDGYIATSPVIAKLCGNISALSFKSTGNAMRVILETNSNTFKGFRGVFEGV